MQQLSPDTRNIATFFCMLICLLASQSVNLSLWIPWVASDTKAGSGVRRFARWLSNSSINPHAWYASIFAYAMRTWTNMPIFIALDTSMLYDRFCCVRFSMIYMNRAIPVAWRVLEHDSSSVKYEQYEKLFEQVKDLLPQKTPIFFSRQRLRMQGSYASLTAIKLDLAHTSERQPEITNPQWFCHA